MMKKQKRGFTLIEILVVMAIIAILSAIVIVAINPARQFAQARNTQRWAGVNAVLNAVNQRMIDNRGIFAPGTTCDAVPTDTDKFITNIDGDDKVDLCSCLVPTYIVSMPIDPSTGSSTDCTSYSTGFTIIASSTTGRITVKAVSAELDEVISATR